MNQSDCLFYKLKQQRFDSLTALLTILLFWFDMCAYVHGACVIVMSYHLEARCRGRVTVGGGRGFWGRGFGATVCQCNKVFKCVLPSKGRLRVRFPAQHTPIHCDMRPAKHTVCSFPFISSYFIAFVFIIPLFISLLFYSISMQPLAQEFPSGLVKFYLILSYLP